MWPRAADSCDTYFRGTEDQIKLYETASCSIAFGSASHMLGLNSCPGLTELLISREDRRTDTVCGHRAQSRVGEVSLGIREGFQEEVTPEWYFHRLSVPPGREGGMGIPGGGDLLSTG